MTMFTGRRRVLAIALAGIPGIPVQATEFPGGLIIEPGAATLLDAGDVIHASTGQSVAVRIQGRASLDADGISLIHDGAGDAAGYAYGVVALDGSDATFVRSHLEMRGDRSVGMQAQQGAVIALRDTALDLRGDVTIGIAALSGALVGSEGGTIRLSGAGSTGLLAAGNGSVIGGRGLVIEQAGDRARSPDASTSAATVRDGARITLTDSTLVSRQDRVHTVWINDPAASFAGVRTALVAEGADASALSMSAGTAGLSGSTLVAPLGYAISTRHAGSDIATVRLQDTAVRGRIESGDTGLRLYATSGDIQGDIARMGNGRLDIAIDGGTWSGAGYQLSSLTLGQSIWHMTADSEVAAIHFGRGSAVVFDHPAGGFHTLRTAQWKGSADATGLMLGVRLDAGGVLRRQATDRVLITGDATGTTRVQVRNSGGAGASTAGLSAANTASDGISLVQVGGQATADAFVLAGDYVAAGPWGYRLHAYAPGQADPAQRLVEGSGSGFWDFRLQSERIGEDGRLAGPDAVRARRSLAPQVPAYLVMSNALFGYAQAALDAMQPSDVSRLRDPALRVRSFGERVVYRSTLPFARYGVDYTRSDHALQLAGDLLAVASGATTLRTGWALSIGTTQVSPRAVDGASQSKAGARGLALTSALSTDSGWYGHAAYGYTHYRIDTRTPSRGEVFGRHRANAADALMAAGFRWELGEHVALDPGASVLWQALRFTTAVDRDGIRVAAGSPERLGIRLGARASLAFAPRGDVLAAWSGYVDARYVASRTAGQSIDLSGVSFATGDAGRGIEFAAGASFELRPDITVHAAVNGRSRLGGRGEAGLGANLGLTLAF